MSISLSVEKYSEVLFSSYIQLQNNRKNMILGLLRAKKLMEKIILHSY